MTLPPACPSVGYESGMKQLSNCWANRFGSEKHRTPARCNRRVENPGDELGLCTSHRDVLLGREVDLVAIQAEDKDELTEAMQAAGVLGMVPAMWLPVDAEED